jgi:hypothetical protein
MRSHVEHLRQLKNVVHINYFAKKLNIRLMTNEDLDDAEDEGYEDWESEEEDREEEEVRGEDEEDEDEDGDANSVDDVDAALD